LIIVSWAGNYLYFQSKQLNQPIFLENFHESFPEQLAGDLEVKVDLDQEKHKEPGA